VAITLLRYDLRAPEWASASHAELYRACLDQCAWADEHGFTMVVLSEHHGVDDGYLSSPLILAGAIAGRTRTVSISVQAILAPIHNPLRLAEDVTALDLISGGRFMLTCAMGYRDEEFEMFGIDRKRRAPLLEESVRTLLDAWTGEPFEYQGRTVRVTPAPSTQPHPMVFVGGSVPAGAKRAARLGLPFMSAVGDPELAKVYDEECKALGVTGGFAIIPDNPVYVHVTEDQEKAWAVVGPHMLHDAKSYDEWQKPDQRSAVHVHATELEAVRDSGVYQCLTPDEAVELGNSTGQIMLHPLVGGLDPATGWESLELFGAKVLPRLR
jgi:alkanesulfonate monooxygenase SsuD/methylene tetrahydromethanopterin reductase-like flavin-dependent oxidoreductase (luciferase family)